MSEFSGSNLAKKFGGTFQSLELSKELSNGLNRMNYKTPTPVQRKALPIVLAGMDMVCMARTGSGKTCVFLLPLLERLKEHKVGGGVRGLVLSPTRELAVQSYKFAKDMSHFQNLRIASIVGGDGIEAQFRALSENPDVIVGTPGRLMHHLREVSTFKLNKVEYLVFDEADRLFEMGFAEQLHEIIRECPPERQTLLFSATMPKQLVQFSRAGLRDPQLIRLDTDVKMSEELRLGYFSMRSNEKLAAFMYLVRSIIPPGQLTIVFTATRHHSELLHQILERSGVTSTIVYGSMDQDARNLNLNKFRSGKVDYLLVTDVAARGIDIPLLNNVINYHFPSSPKLFVHRCGRAARQGRIGYALSLVEPDELAHIIDAHTFLGHKLDTTYTDKTTCGDGPGGSYTLEEMRPEMVHTGTLPQDVLDQEAGYLREMLASSDDIKNQYDVSERAIKLYKKTRTDPSRDGIKGAKALANGTTIQKIHPLIVGCDPEHCNAGAVDKAAFIRQLQSFRPSQTVLESGIGTGSDARASKGRKGKADTRGVAVMGALRKEMKSALERNRDHVTLARDVLDFNTHENDNSDNEKEVGGERAITVDWSELERENDDEDVGREEYMSEEDMVISGSGSGSSRGGNGDVSKIRRESGDSDDGRVVIEQSGVDFSHGSKTNGLSRAAMKRLKKKNKNQTSSNVLDSTSSTTSTSKVTEKKKSASDLANAERAKYYMAYGDEVGDPQQSFSEDALQPKSGLKGHDLMAAERMEEAMLAVAPDDAIELNRKRKIERWDARKKKFVRQTDSEAAASRSKKGRESGAGSKAKPVGDMYAKWKKKTKMEIGGVNAADNDRPAPNVRVNNHVKDELKDAQQIRKEKAQKDKNKLKNMERDKRQSVENARKKKKAEGSKAKGNFSKAGSRKVRLVMRR